jgi:hypothetical protein
MSASDPLRKSSSQFCCAAQRGVELLITSGSSTSVAAKHIIPIVFLHVGDPVAMGLIESLSHPGRNATGFSDILADLSGKLVDLAKELNKSQTTVGYLWRREQLTPTGQLEKRPLAELQSARVSFVSTNESFLSWRSRLTRFPAKSHTSDGSDFVQCISRFAPETGVSPKNHNRLKTTVSSSNNGPALWN